MAPQHTAKKMASDTSQKEELLVETPMIDLILPHPVPLVKEKIAKIVEIPLKHRQNNKITPKVARFNESLRLCGNAQRVLAGAWESRHLILCRNFSKLLC